MGCQTLFSNGGEEFGIHLAQASVAYTGEEKERRGRGKLVIAVMGDDGFSSDKRRMK